MYMCTWIVLPCTYYRYIFHIPIHVMYSTVCNLLYECNMSCMSCMSCAHECTTYYVVCYMLPHGTYMNVMYVHVCMYSCVPYVWCMYVVCVLHMTCSTWHVCSMCTYMVHILPHMYVCMYVMYGTIHTYIHTYIHTSLTYIIHVVCRTLVDHWMLMRVLYLHVCMYDLCMSCILWMYHVICNVCNVIVCMCV